MSPNELEDATGEEAAAILAAIGLFLGAEQEDQGVPLPRAGDRWTSAGRLEAQGRPVTAVALHRGWRG